MEKTRVLLIEDDEAFGVLVTQMLGEGYEVRREATLGEGLTVAGRRAADVVLLDLTLPDSVDAGETLRRFFETHTEVAALILSNHSDPDLMMKAMAVGAQGYLVKKWINSDWLRAAVFQAVLMRQYQRRHKAQLAKIFEELYQAWEEESVRLYKMAESLQKAEGIDTVYVTAEVISDRLARLAQLVAVEIRER